jgi:sterol desaturase/sphingolipid hydroxylase (fatty acid hydroxylase superfamily)
VLGAILWWESRRPLRRAVESKPRRISRSVVIVAVSAAAMQVAGRPVVGPLTALVERRQWGLLKWVSLPRWVEGPLALVLLDYTLYIWHVLTHRVSWL